MSSLFAKVFEHSNYMGQYRWIVGNVSSVGSQLGFNDKISSIIVYKGNNYVEGDIIRFYQDSDYRGGYLDLKPGSYPNIHIQPFSFGDKISSIYFNPSENRGSGLIVRLRVILYEHVGFGGQKRDILLSESNLNRVGFNDKVSSIRVLSGEDYTAGWVCDFYQHANYSGGILQQGPFAPGTSLSDIKKAPYSFNDVISSVKIYKED